MKPPMNPPMKLWEKNTPLDALVELFTVGNDRTMDERLARWDVVGSIAHATMLGQVGLLPMSTAQALVQELSTILQEIDAHGISIEDGVEDIHSQIELELTRRLGDVGKTIHVGRSRNDQVAVDLKLFLRHEMRQLRSDVHARIKIMLDVADEHGTTSLPGYTHYQVAMPSSFALWVGGYAEALLEDLRVVDMAIDAANANPLGSAAGYGTSLPIDRQQTTRALNFDRLHVTSTFAQMSRGRTEKLVAMAMAQVASTLARFAMDVVQYMSQNYALLTLPDHLTTGSSIMPHKKNPDVFEVLRARCNRLQSLPTELALVQTNLPSGYHRDLQFVKDRIIPALDEMRLCVHVAQAMVPHVRPIGGVMHDSRYRYIDSVDRVNDLVAQGVPFRDAYRAIADSIANGTYNAGSPLPDHVPNDASAAIGSPGNPGITLLRERWVSSHPSSHLNSNSNSRSESSTS